MHQNKFAAEAVSADSTGGAYSTPADPLDVFGEGKGALGGRQGGRGEERGRGNGKGKVGPQSKNPGYDRAQTNEEKCS